MEFKRKSCRFFRGATLFWTAFIGVGACVGTGMFFADPQNGLCMAGVLTAIQARMPFADIFFRNLIFPGIALLIVNGITNLTAFVLLLKNRRAGYLLGWIFGVTLMLWICVQFYVFAPVVYAIDVIFFLFGLCQFICGFIAFVRYSQLQFHFDPADYPNVGANPGEDVVVFYSRDGYAKKLAYEKADALGCGVIELVAYERTAGNLGFWWCGRFAMLRLGMPIEPVTDVLSSYDTVHVFAPVWVFAICAPVRQFFVDYAGTLPDVALTLVHFSRIGEKGLFHEPERLLGQKLCVRQLYLCRFGNVRAESI